MACAILAAACSGGGPEGDDSTTSSAPNSTDPAPSTSTTTAAPAATTTTTTVPVPRHVDAAGFDDHTVPHVESVDEWFALARRNADRSVVKFTISDFGGFDPTVRWADSNFYELHDEWFYFRLLNGQPVPGAPDQPATGLGPFESIDDIYQWAEPIRSLPVNLRRVDSQTFGRERIYSSRFYELARAQPRVFGAGSVVHVPDSPDGQRWLIELEYRDAARVADVERYFSSLARTLPSEIGDDLEWVVRSPEQQDLADEMSESGHPLADRVVRWIEVVPPGEAEIYNEGIAAGKLLMVDDIGSQLARAIDTDVIIIDHVPDYLPPGSALITSQPQTPLAHVNLLARNRGIPNLSISGVSDDPGIQQAARVRPYVVVHASGGDVDIALIETDEFRAWERLTNLPSARVPTVDTDEIDLVVDLRELSREIGDMTQLDEWRPIIGGKSAGFVVLLDTHDVPMPPTPLAITVRPYFEHLEQVERELAAMLADRDFRNDPRARYLFFEGPDDYEDFYAAERDLEYGRTLATEHPPTTILGSILEAGGFKSLFRDHSIDANTLDQIVSELEASFGHYDATQGLRFRSSSSVEDVEGFTGAGLYNSNTGFLDPGAQTDPDDRKKSVEYTLKKTWASYWAFEAFEERRRENIDHTSGGMGVTVHARFDDHLEANNGVATITFEPARTDVLATAIINVQAGAVSVANPVANAAVRPEIIEVAVLRNGDLRIERLQDSSLIDNTAPDNTVLNETAVTELVQHLISIADAWRDMVNGPLPFAQEVSAVSLDVEFKTMRSRWPAGSGDEVSGLVIKQARRLDPGLRGVPSSVVALPVPRDVLARAARVASLTCDGQRVTAVWTDPLIAPDMGHSTTPFTHPATPDIDGCTSRTLHSSPDVYLLELLEDHERARLIE